MWFNIFKTIFTRKCRESFFDRFWIRSFCRIFIPPLLETRSVCLAFYYHMWGFHMGTLQVVIRRKGGRLTNWTLSGDQGNIWLENRLPLTLRTDDEVRKICATSDDEVLSGRLTGFRTIQFATTTVLRQIGIQTLSRNS